MPSTDKSNDQKKKFETELDTINTSLTSSLQHNYNDNHLLTIRVAKVIILYIINGKVTLQVIKFRQTVKKILLH